MLGVGPTKKADALLKHGLLPEASCASAMRNFKPPTKPAAGRGGLSPSALKDWQVEVLLAKLRHVRDTPFPNQNTSLANGEEQTAELYYHEVERLHKVAQKEKRDKETKGDAKGVDPTGDTGGDDGGGYD